MIERPPRLFRALVPGGVFRIPHQPDRGPVYLTFDDGPIPEATPQVLDILDRYGAKGTFFMVGDNARRHPHLVSEVLRRGHGIGNHTMHHLQGIKVHTRTYLADVAEAEQWIPATPSELSGKPLFRPPHGLLRLGQARALRHKYTLLMYDLVSRDYSKHLSGEQVLDNVKRYARPGAIIVFHDSIKALPRTMYALPRSLEWLLEQGYEFRLI